MGMFSFLNNKKNVSIEEMMEKALLWTETYMMTFVPQNMPNRTDIRNEMFIFNAWTAWYYCLHHDLIKVKDNETANRFIATVFVYSSLDDKFDIQYFFELFKARFEIYRADVNGVANSKYPGKMYFPVSLYCALYHRQYKLDPTEGIDEYEMIDEMESFISNFITHWNTTQHDMNVDWG